MAAKSRGSCRKIPSPNNMWMHTLDTQRWYVANVVIKGSVYLCTDLQQLRWLLAVHAFFCFGRGVWFFFCYRNAQELRFVTHYKNVSFALLGGTFCHFALLLKPNKIKNGLNDLHFCLCLWLRNCCFACSLICRVLSCVLLFKVGEKGHGACMCVFCLC